MAQNLTVEARNDNSISNVAETTGFTASESFGFGAAFVMGSYHSSAQATVAANVLVPGNVLVDSSSVNSTNVNRSFSQVSDPLATTPFLESLSDFLNGIDFGVILDEDIEFDPTTIGPDVSLAPRRSSSRPRTKPRRWSMTAPSWRWAGP